MKYMLLIYNDPNLWETLPQEEAQGIMGEYIAFTNRIVESGEFVNGEPLQAVDTATTVKVRDGGTQTTDGPFVETKEHLGGYYVVDCKDLDRAIEIAAEIPDARYAGVEVRPVLEMG